jgi:hypothetical protein
MFLATPVLSATLVIRKAGVRVSEVHCSTFVLAPLAGERNIQWPPTPQGQELAKDSRVANLTFTHGTRDMMQQNVRHAPAPAEVETVLQLWIPCPGARLPASFCLLRTGPDQSPLPDLYHRLQALSVEDHCALLPFSVSLAMNDRSDSCNQPMPHDTYELERPPSRGTGLTTHVQCSYSSPASRLALPPAAAVLAVMVCSQPKRMR